MTHREKPSRSGWAPLPHLIRPILATAGSLPAGETGWWYELKWDGVRAVGYVQGGPLRLRSRAARDCTGTYPELQGLATALGSRQAVLDGDVVAFDAAGCPSFEALQPRVNLTDVAWARRSARTRPVSHVLCDLLHLNGRSTLGLAYLERRRAARGPPSRGERWAVPAAHLPVGGRSSGLEGVVAKRFDSPYQPGRRSRAWVKVKVTSTQPVVVGGRSPGKGTRSGSIGAQLVGIPSARGLEHLGKAGNGSSEGTLAELGRRAGGRGGRGQVGGAGAGRRGALDRLTA